MGGVIDDIAGLWGGSKQDKAFKTAIDTTNAQIAANKELWERQFGPVSDALKQYMMGVIGAGPAPERSDWQNQYEQRMRQEIESGMRPGEESAKDALMKKVRANPISMSFQGYAKGLKDIVLAGQKARGDAFRTGMSQAETLPFNMGMSFMGRTPYQTKAEYMPNYGFAPNPEWAKLAGKGLNEIVDWGSKAYGSMFGGSGADTSGFETYSTETGMGPEPGYFDNLDVAGVR